MTIPALITKMKNIRDSAVLKEDYSILSQVVRRSYDEGANYNVLADNNIDEMKKWFETYMLPYMNVANICYNTKGCWTEQIVKHLDGTKGYNAGHGMMGAYPICFVLNNGSNVCVDDRGQNGIATQWGLKLPSSAPNTMMEFYVDVNGNKQPNVYGKDVFVFVAGEDQFYTAGAGLEDDEIIKDCSKGGKGYYCTARAKNNGWKIPEFK